MKLHPVIRRLHELALEQGWRVQEAGSELHWFSPDRAQSMVVTPKNPNEANRGLQNSIAELRRRGLRIREEDTIKPAKEDDDTATNIDPFARSVAELIEQELEKRTRNLQDQVTALENDNRDLRQRLADAESDVEQRAEAAALAAVRKMLAERKVPR